MLNSKTSTVWQCRPKPGRLQFFIIVTTAFILQWLKHLFPGRKSKLSPSGKIMCSDGEKFSKNHNKVNSEARIYTDYKLRSCCANTFFPCFHFVQTVGGKVGPFPFVVSYMWQAGQLNNIFGFYWNSYFI